MAVVKHHISHEVVDQECGSWKGVNDVHVHYFEPLKIINDLLVQTSPIDNHNDHIHKQRGFKQNVCKGEFPLLAVNLTVPRTKYCHHNPQRSYFQCPVSKV